MSKHPFLFHCTSLSLTTVLAVAMAATTRSQLLGSEAARLDGFTQADGTNFFALGLKPSVPAANGPREVVILVSTAASESGDYRIKSLDTVRATLKRLSPDDRVKLVAFDLAAAPLTQGFVAPNSPEMVNAMNALEQRTPLGSCDLEKAFDSTVKSFSGDSKLPRAAIYIGDGSSRANLLTTDQLDRVINGLVAEHVPVTTFGVGPRIDDQLLDILAARTGGVAVRESLRVDAESSGFTLADAVRGTVVWPKANAVKWPAGLDVYPNTMPPLRNDRDTVLFGDSKSPLPKQIDVDLDNGQKLAWNVPDLKSDPANAYLARLADRAKVDDGRTLPMLDWDSLASAKVRIEAGGKGIDELALEAFKGGNMDSATKLADEALLRNPNDREAQAVKDAVAKKAAGGAVPPLPGAAPVVAAPAPAKVVAGEPGDLNMQGDPGAGIPPPEGAAAVGEIAQNAAFTDQLEKKVANAINDARTKVSTNPDLALQSVEQMKQEVLAATDLPPEVSDRLQRKLTIAGREIQHKKEEVIFRQQQLIQSDVEHRAMQLIVDGLAHDEAKTKQLMERFNSLMAEGRHKLAEETVGAEVAKIVNSGSLPNGPTLEVTAVNWARFKGNEDDIQQVRVAKQKGFIDTMLQVEKSHVPIPDEPPIIYPDAETWKELTARRKEKYSSTSLAKSSPAEKKIEEALKSPTTIEFVETPLKDVVDYLKDVHKIEIQLDLPGLKDAGVDENTPVTKNIKGISLRSALRLMLDELQLKYVIHNEVLLITSPQKAESDEFMTTKVYPVADLVLPIPQMGLSGLGGLGGGMGGGGQGGVGGQGGMGGMGGMGGGGGFGGGGGGMGGGGMGGMGGGMGGGGMGGMGGGMGGGGGGGFFNIPREILPPQNRGPRFFDVPIETISQRPAKVGEAVEAVPVAQVEPVKRVAPIHLDIAPGADVKKAWEVFFAQHDPEHNSSKLMHLSPEEFAAYERQRIGQKKAVLETVQQLRDGAAAAFDRKKPEEAAKKYEEIIALIEAALRHDQAQSWMYELLSLSMKAAGRPQAEIDRAIMSAADFAQNSADLMFLGGYLMQTNMERRALQIFHQVALAEPLWPEPYMSGMQAARKLNDIPGLQWSTAGILGQAWLPAQSKIWDDALRVAQATLKGLRDQKRNEEADQFDAAIKQAMIRDCVVTVKWTGDADIDVMVKEPAGTVCSLRNQRTTSGGMLLDDVPNTGGKEQITGHMAVYTCPRAFSGNYQLLVRRVFGKVSTGNVIVEVNTNYNTDNGKAFIKKIPVSDGEALVKFDLADGRRKESLHDAQVVNATVAVVGQHEQQHVLAQQLAALNDPNQAAALGAVQQAAAAAGSAQAQQQLNPALWPTALHGAVGYAPVIITLPEGTNYAATGVVSADRRYVRITCVPFFSRVSDVHTFSIDSGATTSTPGIGSNGAGYSGAGGGGAN